MRPSQPVHLGMLWGCSSSGIPRKGMPPHGIDHTMACPYHGRLGGNEARRQLGDNWATRQLGDNGATRQLGYETIRRQWGYETIGLRDN